MEGLRLRFPRNSLLGWLKPEDHNVGPVPRRFLTRADNSFGALLGWTLCNKLLRDQVPIERCERP